MIGTHSRTTIETFSGAGGEHTHIKEYAYDADHPAVLVGADQAPDARSSSSCTRSARA